jgi:hypothetical protein
MLTPKFFLQKFELTPKFFLVKFELPPKFINHYNVFPSNSPRSSPSNTS